MTKTVSIGPLSVSNDRPFALISGPCQMESLEHARKIAGSLAETCARLEIPFVFKASYDKANRSSLGGQRGLGMEKGLEYLAAIRDEFGCPVLTDVHEAGHCAPAAEVCDVLHAISRKI